MRIRLLIPLLIISVAPVASSGTGGREPYSSVPREQQKNLAEAIVEYVKAYQTHDWEKLYGLVSDSAKGGVARERFVERMKATHREAFSSFPDLIKFDVDRTTSSDKNEYDIYGCGEARREKMNFKGIAIVHAVLEHNSWHFAGWSFTEFPNEPCNLLKNPSWQPPHPMEWGAVMGELRNEAESK